MPQGGDPSLDFLKRGQQKKLTAEFEEADLLQRHRSNPEG